MSDEENFAKADMERLGDNIEGPKEMGKGGGELKGGSEGPGVRAGKLASESEVRMSNYISLTRVQMERLREYHKLVSAAINGASDEELNKLYKVIISDSKHTADLETGGFLSEHSIKALVDKLRAEAKASRNPWEEVFDQLIK